ncbi:MAG: O-antigen ligase family protein [Oscillospiraceae bacterium]|nr:O-antigen ligase family protein [Oscillospiraceae bacterium]
MKTRLPAAEKWTEGYLVLLFLGLPLLLHNGYFDVMETKFAYFLLLTALWLLGLLWFAAMGQGLEGEGLPAGALACLVFCAAGILAALLGGHGRAALLAADNRYQGLLALLLYGAMVAGLSRCAMGRLSLWALLGGFGVNGLLGVLNFLGFDPLGLIRPLTAFDRGRFLGLIGNINFFGAYMTLLTPAAALLACGAEKRWQRLGLGLLALLGLWGAMTARSESAVLGFGAAGLLLPLFARGRERKRSLWLLPGLVLGMQSFALLSGRDFSALTALLLRPAVSAALLFGGLGAYALGQRSRRAYGLALLGAVLALGLGLLLANTVIPAERLGRLGDWLVLDADFGSDRGAIWRSCFALYGEFPWWQKLIGAGSGVLARWDTLHRVFPDAVVDSAHNEYIHYLLTHGLVGLGAYLGFLFCALRAAYRSGSPLYRALGLGAAAYAAQALVNIAQSATTPLFLAILGLLTGAAALDRADGL